VSTKLVEVALPLEAISKACKADKDRKVGTIKNVHKWFAPMPTPAWRALLFATLVDDPGDEEGRAELLKLITRLVPENGGAPDAPTLEEARKLIEEASGGKPPTVFDPFCGGGSTLVEAQRLGLPAAGSDLNPVAVLITRTITQLVPQVAGRPPLVADSDRLRLATVGSIDGFLADCDHYAGRVRDQVWEGIGHMYPPPPGGGTVVAWLWARTVQCPNPACRAIAPLASSFWLSKRKGAEKWLKPIDCRPGAPVRFDIGHGPNGPPPAPKVGRGATFRCVVCDEPIGDAYVKGEGMAGRLGVQLMAVAIDGPDGRRFLPPEPGFESPKTSPEGPFEVEQPDYARWFSSPQFGLPRFSDLFTNRQLTALGTFADAVAEVLGWVRAEGGDPTYAAAIASVLGLCVGRLAQAHSAQSRWYIDNRNGSTTVQAAFGRHALPMVWDFAELNPFSDGVGNWLGLFESISGALRSLPPSELPAHVFQADARVAIATLDTEVLVVTDPPYFAQIGYADLSDYFYVWLRRALAEVHPDLFATVTAPKATELIAAPYRHGGSMTGATDYFVSGFTETFRSLALRAAASLPMLIVYAHREEETKAGALSLTAWDAMLTAILAADLRIVGTWPIHATGSSRQIGLGTNALASYVVLVCRPQIQGARVVDRQGFLAALRAELPKAIRKLQEAAVSSIDLGQATIGPGMAIFSRFSKVIEPSGQPMSVHSARELISQVQAEVLDEFVGNLDSETRWAMVWYRDHGLEDGSFGDADTLSKTTVTSVEGLVGAGIVTARAGKVRLRDRDELPVGWSPRKDDPPTVWEVTQHLTWRVTSTGEESAVPLFRNARRWVDDARALAYWLSATAAGRGRAKDALDYDALITSWPVLMQKAAQEEQPSIPGADI
jgi:putative DNA methylase